MKIIMYIDLVTLLKDPKEILEKYKKFVSIKLRKDSELWVESLSDEDKDFSLMDLCHTDVSYGHFFKFNFRGANLSKCDLSYCDFIRADLQNTNLNKTKFTNTILAYANLKGARLADTLFLSNNSLLRYGVIY